MTYMPSDKTLATNDNRVHVIGAGLAGSEAAYFLAEHGVSVILHEMRPRIMTPAHKTGRFAELICSNSLKSKVPDSAPGILKSEMANCESLIIRAAGTAAVAGGDALTVDRDVFAEFITRAISTHENISIIDNEVSEPPKDGITILASGPLTSRPLFEWLEKNTAAGSLYFFDAIAPVVEGASIDMSKAFLANRYDKGGEEAYLNCPLNEEEYYSFVHALLTAEKVAPKPFEKEIYFHGCQPIEAIALSGLDSLRFGPMKPVGLLDPKTGSKPFAVVQLRAENRSKTSYNLVGFQTKLRYGEQQSVFRKIPALKNAEFLRFGSMHRNTYVCGPEVLRPDLSLKGRPKIYLAGQITGVEGYVESAACGLLAAIFVMQRLRGLPHSPPPANTALGALLKHVVASDGKNYQPSNIHFGLLDPTVFVGVSGLKRDEARRAISEQARVNVQHWWKYQDL